ncbi:MAG TPA: glycosyltransferase family 4 protein [Anaerolineae bacterium]
MRIAIVAGEYPPLQGGLGAYTREAARALVAVGNQVIVYAHAAAGAPREEHTNGFQVLRDVTHWGWSSLRRLNHFIDACQPDVLNLQYQAAAYQMHPAINLLPRLTVRRLPVVVTFHDLRVPYLFPKAGPLRWQAILDMARHASATIVTNVEDRATLQHAHIQKLAMIPIGSNITPAPLTGFDRATWLRARAIPETSRVVGYFGFMNESKGGETLVRALSQLRQRGLDVTLLLIGGQTGTSDPTNVAYASFIMRLADELQVSRNIALTGFLDDRGVSEALAACDCVALPYRDGASFRRGTLMAALAHGCVTVTTLPGISVPELKHGENVLLVPPDNPVALAGAIHQALLDAPLRGRLRAGSVQLSTLFSWDRIAVDMANVFERARS